MEVSKEDFLGNMHASNQVNQTLGDNYSFGVVIQDSKYKEPEVVIIPANNIGKRISYYTTNFDEDMVSNDKESRVVGYAQIGNKKAMDSFLEEHVWI